MSNSSNGERVRKRIRNAGKAYSTTAAGADDHNRHRLGRLTVALRSGCHVQSVARFS